MKLRKNHARYLVSCIARVALIGLVVTPSSSFGAGYVGAGSITYMQSAYGGWLIRTSGTQSNPDSCADGAMIYLSPDNTQYKELFAALLTARTAGQTVSVYVSGCHAVGYKVLNMIAFAD